MVVGLTNPKTILFFVAFLPQFTNAAAGHVAVQMAVLGVVFGVVGAAACLVVTLLPSRRRKPVVAEAGVDPTPLEAAR